MAHKLIIAPAALIVFGALLAFYASSPLRRTDAGVQRWLEKSTPVGSSLSDVEAVATRRGWYFHRGEAGGHDGPWQFTGTYIRGELGEYQGLPFRTSVTAFWEFDVSNRLMGIRIWKTRDAL
jgi:hypothetical protein